MLLTLAAINFALGAFDCWLTRRQMHEFGIHVELNTAIRWLSAWLGVDAGVLLGIAIPLAAQTGLLVWVHWTTVLAILVGFRIKMAFIQAQSIVFEREIKAFKASLRGDSAPPSSAPHDEGIVTPPPSKDKDA